MPKSEGFRRLRAACIGGPRPGKEWRQAIEVWMGVDRDARHHFPGLSVTVSWWSRCGLGQLGIAV
jgi:hypothetical protein